MRSIKFKLNKSASRGWDGAIYVLESFIRSGGKASEHLAQLPTAFPAAERRACHSLFLGALRNAHRTRHALKPLLAKPPKPLLEAILLIAGNQLIEASETDRAKVVHHAVERAKAHVSRPEAGFLNAVLRKLAPAIHRIDPLEQPAAYYSHPEWLVRHWQETFPVESVTALLRWNQSLPRTFLRLDPGSDPVPEFLRATPWPGFFAIRPGASFENEVLPLLNKRNAYIKDPSTRFAAELLAPVGGENILDLCAAPGGKACDCARQMNGEGRIVAVDLPGSRIDRLRENFDRIGAVSPALEIVESDALALTPELLQARDLPVAYDAVMLDAPCSNTGVIQRRTDVKCRLQPDSIAEAAQLQEKLIRAAATFVRPGGRLVYSTCSIELEENRNIVEGFLRSESGQHFSLASTLESYPWESGHDGAAAYLFRRNP